MAIECKPIIDITSIIQPLMLRSVFTGEEFKFDTLIDVLIQDKIEKALLQSVELPEEFAELKDVICLSLDMNKIKTIMKVLRGEEVQPGEGLEKTIELIVNLQMLSALTSAFSGGAGGGKTGTAG